MPTYRFPQETTDPLAPPPVEDNCFERLDENTNKLIPTQTDGGTKPAVYLRDHERSSFLAADQCTVAYLSL